MNKFMESAEASALAKELSDANIAYRKGSPTMSDVEWDRLLDELRDLQPDHPFLKEIGYIDNTSERKQELPFYMSSMEKIKVIEEYLKWLKKYDIEPDTDMILTAKFQ